MKKLYLFFLAALFAASPLSAQSIYTVGLSGFVPTTCNLFKVGIASNTCQLQGLGGVPSGGNYTFTLLSGSFSGTGLSMTTGSGGGLISGTPVSATPISITARITDNAPTPGHVDVPLTIIPATISTVLVNAGTGSVNTSSTLQLAVTGIFSDNSSIDLTAVATYACTTGAGCTASSISAGGLFTAGVTTGPATAQATFGGTNGTATVTVTTGVIVSITYPLTTLVNGQINQPYSGQGQQITASGGTPPYTCSITSGSLPAGLALSNIAGNTNCLIGGTPTASGAGSTITFKVADSASNSSTVVISGGITVASLSSLAVSLAQATIVANTATNVSATGTYSDSSTASLPNTTSGATFVQKSVGVPTSSAVTAIAAPATATTTGNLIVVAQFSGDNGAACPTYTAPTDTAGNTYSAATTQIGGAVTPPPYYNCGQIWYSANITGNAANVVTCHTGSVTGAGCLQVEYTGIPTTPLDKHPAPTQATSVSSCTPNSVTTIQANELGIIACIPNSASGYTLPSGYVSRDTTNSLWIFADQTYTSIQTSIVPSTTFAGGLSNEDAFIVTFKANSPAAGGVVWTSATPTCATVSSTGVVTGQSIQTQCTSVITGTVGAVNNTATVTVNPSNVNTDTGIIINPASAFQILGAQQQFTANGNVTGNIYQAAWGSSNLSIATVDPSSGLAKCVTAGTVTISGTVSGFTSTNATLTCNTSSGGTVTAATCNSSDVQAALNTVGVATVIIPTGSCTWHSGVAIPAGVTLTGTGTPNTLASQIGASASCSGTAITDSLPSGAMFNATVSSGTTRLSCMKIIPTVPRTGFGGPISFTGLCSSGGCPSVRIDNLVIPSTWANLGISNTEFAVLADLFGVADHNSVGDATGTGGDIDFINQGFGSWQGIGSFGDNSWATPDTFGTIQAFYIENNAFNEAHGVDGEPDSGGGARYVCRFNTFINTQAACYNHGTDTSQRWRGVRQEESYANTITSCINNACDTLFEFRSAVGLIFGNRIGTFTNTIAKLDSQRSWRPTPPFLGCDGTQPWDTNDGVTYYTGTVGSVSGYTLGGTGGIVTDSDAPGWSPAGKWFAYNFVDITRANSGFQMSTSGSNTLTSVANNLFAAPVAGDSYKILRATVCMDQPGRGQGQLLTGSTPTLASTGAPGPVSQALDPIYEFADSLFSNGNVKFVAIGTAEEQMQFARDYYSEAVSGTTAQTGQTSASSPFNGTTTCTGAVSCGVGWGALGFRPSTCTTGVGYYATDQGNWNKSGINFPGQSFSQGQLYVCSSSNVWSLKYTPYTYPHPLDH